MEKTVETDPARPVAGVGDPESGLRPIPVLRPRLPPAERIFPYLQRVDAARIYSNWGPLERELESRLAGHFGLEPGAVRCASSGTQALAGCILGSAGRARSGRPLAVVPAFTFIATALAVEECGYEPYIVDIDPETLALDPNALLELPDLSEVGLVVPVAPFGRPVPQNPWIDFSDKTGIPVVIDDAASFDRLGDDLERYVGAIPLALSFHATKAFGCGEGGGVLCTDEALASDIARALNFGFRNSRECMAQSMNGKMSEYHAAVGLAELDGWDEKHAAFQNVGERYREHFDRAGIGDRIRTTPDVSAAYAILVCRDAAESGVVREALADAAIEHRLWYGGGLTDHAHLLTCRRTPLPVTEALAPCHLGLPLAVDLDDASIGRIVHVLQNALAGSA